MQAVVHPDGRLALRNDVFRAALGRAGVGVHKLEADGATPAGVLPLRLAARAVFGDKATDIVISTDAVRQILALPENISLLQQGRIVIVYNSLP